MMKKKLSALGESNQIKSFQNAKKQIEETPEGQSNKVKKAEKEQIKQQEQKK